MGEDKGSDTRTIGKEARVIPPEEEGVLKDHWNSLTKEEKYNARLAKKLGDRDISRTRGHGELRYVRRPAKRPLAHIKQAESAIKRQELESIITELNKRVQYEENAKGSILSEFLRGIQDKLMTPEHFGELYPELYAGKFSSTIVLPKSQLIRPETKEAFKLGSIEDRLNIKKQKRFVVLFSGPISSGKTSAKEFILEHYNYIMESTLYNLYQKQIEQVRSVGLDTGEDIKTYAKRRLFHSLLQENVHFNNKTEGAVDYIIDFIEKRVTSGFYDQKRSGMHLVAQLLSFTQKPMLHSFKEVTDFLPQLKIFYKDPEKLAEKVQDYTEGHRLEIHYLLWDKEGIILLDRDIPDDYEVFVRLQRMEGRWGSFAEENYLHKIKMARVARNGKSIIHYPDVIALFVAHDSLKRYLRTVQRGGPEMEAVKNGKDLERDPLFRYMTKEGEVYRQFNHTLKRGDVTIAGFLPPYDPATVVDINADDDIDARPDLRAEILATIIIHSALYQQRGEFPLHYLEQRAA